MLRIQRFERDQRVGLALSGDIEGKHVPEVRRLINEERRDPEFVLDLKEVQLVDREAVRFLADCHSLGITLENACEYIREWIARERTATQR